MKRTRFQYFIKRIVLQFTPWQVCSIERHRYFFRKMFATLQLMRTLITHTYIYNCL